jgi:hypothetical protein
VYKSLEELGLIDNTIVIYTSDHGDMLGDHGLWQKFVLYEASVAVPMIVSYPKTIPRGKVSQALVEFIGIYPTVLLKRRRLYRRWGRNQFNAYLSVLLTVFRPAHRMRLRLATASGEAVRETPLVLICSNAFQMEAFQLAGIECLAAGQFALYVARMSGRKTILHLGLRALLRHLRPGQDYEVICASDVTIETLRGHHFRASVDGELVKIKSPMRFRVMPRLLRVLAPQDNDRLLQPNQSIPAHAENFDHTP